MATQRQLRVQELLVQEISDIVRRQVKDPRIGFVTITDAEVTPDLRQALVFISALGTPEEAAAALKGLNSAAGFIRSEFGRRASLRFNPTIEFRADPGIERGARIQELLASLREEESHGPEPLEPGSSGGPKIE
jgi:ribosome-binding factor A